MAEENDEYQDNDFESDGGPTTSGAGGLSSRERGDALAISNEEYEMLLAEGDADDDSPLPHEVAMNLEKMARNEQGLDENEYRHSEENAGANRGSADIDGRDDIDESDDGSNSSDGDRARPPVTVAIARPQIPSSPHVGGFRDFFSRENPIKTNIRNIGSSSNNSNNNSKHLGSVVGGVPTTAQAVIAPSSSSGSLNGSKRVGRRASSFTGQVVVHSQGNDDDDDVSFSRRQGTGHEAAVGQAQVEAGNNAITGSRNRRGLDRTSSTGSLSSHQSNNNNNEFAADGSTNNQHNSNNNSNINGGRRMRHSGSRGEAGFSEPDSRARSDSISTLSIDSAIDATSFSAVPQSKSHYPHNSHHFPRLETHRESVIEDASASGVHQQYKAIENNNTVNEALSRGGADSGVVSALLLKEREELQTILFTYKEVVHQLTQSNMALVHAMKQQQQQQSISQPAASSSSAAVAVHDGRELQHTMMPTGGEGAGALDQRQDNNHNNHNNNNNSRKSYSQQATKSERPKFGFGKSMKSSAVPSSAPPGSGGGAGAGGGGGGGGGNSVSSTTSGARPKSAAAASRVTKKPAIDCSTIIPFQGSSSRGSSSSFNYAAPPSQSAAAGGSKTTSLLMQQQQQRGGPPPSQQQQRPPHHKKIEDGNKTTTGGTKSKADDEFDAYLDSLGDAPGTAEPGTRGASISSQGGRRGEAVIRRGEDDNASRTNRGYYDTYRGGGGTEEQQQQPTFMSPIRPRGLGPSSTLASSPAVPATYTGGGDSRGRIVSPTKLDSQMLVDVAWLESFIDSNQNESGRQAKIIAQHLNGQSTRVRTPKDRYDTGYGAAPFDYCALTPRDRTEGRDALAAHSFPNSSDYKGITNTSVIYERNPPTELAPYDSVPNVSIPKSMTGGTTSSVNQAGIAAAYQPMRPPSVMRPSSRLKSPRGVVGLSSNTYNARGQQQETVVRRPTSSAATARSSLAPGSNNYHNNNTTGNSSTSASHSTGITDEKAIRPNINTVPLHVSYDLRGKRPESALSRKLKSNRESEAKRSIDEYVQYIIHNPTIGVRYKGSVPTSAATGGAGNNDGGGGDNSSSKQAFGMEDLRRNLFLIDTPRAAPPPVQGKEKRKNGRKDDRGYGGGDDGQEGEGEEEEEEEEEEVYVTPNATKGPRRDVFEALFGLG